MFMLADGPTAKCASVTLRRVAFITVLIGISVSNFWSMPRRFYEFSSNTIFFRLLPQTENDTVLAVYLVPSSESILTKGEHAHFMVDGIEKSPFLRLTFNSTEENSVWVIDMVRSDNGGSCEGLILPEVEKASIARKQMYGENASWPIYVMDWNDYVYHWKCDEIQNFVDKDDIHFGKRSIVSGRKIIDNTTATMDLGMIKEFPVPVKHVPYAVRTDFVEEIATILARHYIITGYPNDSWNLADIDRPRDVAHYWPLYQVNKRSILRYTVSRTIHNLTTSDSTNITGFVGVTGAWSEEGRTRVQTKYVRSMLKHKIVVVSQRDEHEDHYRLMEALACGPLVFTDPMLSLPQGFSEGENIIFYHNMTDLRHKILFYLENDTERIRIAQKGWKEAMSRHRSWHVAEDVLLGEIRTIGMHPNRNAAL